MDILGEAIFHRVKEQTNCEILVNCLLVCAGHVLELKKYLIRLYYRHFCAKISGLNVISKHFLVLSAHLILKSLVMTSTEKKTGKMLTLLRPEKYNWASSENKLCRNRANICALHIPLYKKNQNT